MKHKVNRIDGNRRPQSEAHPFLQCAQFALYPPGMPPVYLLYKFSKPQLAILKTTIEKVAAQTEPQGIDKEKDTARKLALLIEFSGKLKSRRVRFHSVKRSLYSLMLDPIGDGLAERLVQQEAELRARLSKQPLGVTRHSNGSTLSSDAQGNTISVTLAIDGMKKKPNSRTFTISKHISKDDTDNLVRLVNTTLAMTETHPRDSQEVTEQKLFLVSRFIDEINTRRIIFRGEERPLSFAVARLVGWEAGIGRLTANRADLRDKLNRLYLNRVMDSPDMRKSIDEFREELEQGIIRKLAERLISKQK